MRLPARPARGPRAGAVPGSVCAGAVPGSARAGRRPPWPPLTCRSLALCGAGESQAQIEAQVCGQGGQVLPQGQVGAAGAQAADHPRHGRGQGGAGASARA